MEKDRETAEHQRLPVKLYRTPDRLVVALPVAEQTRPARLTLQTVAPGRGQRVGSAGHPIQPLSTAEHRVVQAGRAVKSQDHLLREAVTRSERRQA